MKIVKSYKFRLKPTKEQVAMLKQHGGNSRFTWNKLLEYSNNIKKDTNKFPNHSQLQKQIIQIKSANDFIKISHSQPIQINALRLADTFARAFKPEVVAIRNQKIAKAYTIQDEEEKSKALAIAQNYGFPNFKKKSNSSDSLFYPQNFIIKKTRIFFPKLKWINYVKHRNIEGTPKFVTITKDGNQFYVSVTSELEIEEIQKKPLDQANIAGSDVGLIDFAVLSDGTKIANPRTLKKYQKKLRRAQRKLAKQELKETGKKTFYGKEIKESSKRREKQLLIIQRIHRKIRNIRNDFLHKTAYHIINKYDGIILEKLDIQEMLQNGSKSMNRSILDASWFEFARILGYKSVWLGKYFLQLDQYFPSTQLCNSCGHRARLSLRDRVYICPHCGMRAGRDLNAARNIRDEGIRILKEILNNTVAATGIYARGLDTVVSGMKREKRRFQRPLAVA